MSWKGFTDFKQECVTSWTKLFATNEVQFTDNAIDNFLAFVDHMSCSADTYVSLGGSNGCADQLTNWDGTKKVGLETVTRIKHRVQRCLLKIRKKMFSFLTLTILDGLYIVTMSVK